MDRYDLSSFIYQPSVPVLNYWKGKFTVAHTMLDETLARADDKLRASFSLIAAPASHRNHVCWVTSE